MNTTEHTITVNASPVSVLVDPIRIEQVVTNLLDNAVKYSPGGGSIRVEVSQPRPDVAQLSVTDNGIGVPPEHRERIFERFYQVKKGSGGMGIGLYISREIIDLHGGSIGVDTLPEGGTRFWVRLPVQVSG
jgi:two-component system, OmpR family, sensor histidine kinase VicK